MRMSSDLHALLVQVGRRWSSNGVPPHVGASDSAIAEFEQRHGVRMPPDVAMYFRVLGGMELGDWDEELIRFWKLAEVEPVPSLAAYFVFADWSISAHEYAVQISDAHPSSVVCMGREPLPIASTLETFWKQYLQDPAFLFPRA